MKVEVQHCLVVDRSEDPRKPKESEAENVIEKGGVDDVGKDDNVEDAGETAKNENGELSKQDKKLEFEATVPFLRLFSFADKYDYILIAFGTIGAAIHGASFPLILLFIGKLLNSLGSDSTGLSHTVNKYALYFVYLGIITLFSTWLEIAFWMHTGERQTTKLRAKYLHALLRQDVSYFDTSTNTGEFINSVASDPIMIQDAISEKMGSFIHNLATLAAGFTVGFINQWRLALLGLGALPLIMLAGGLYAYFFASAQTKSMLSYSEAGSIAEQAISQVRTVYSFVGETKFAKAYAESLEKTLKYGTRGGLAKGFGIGCTLGVIFAVYALMTWYGGTLVRKGLINGAEVLTTIMALVFASLALGQALANLPYFGRGRVAAYKIFQLIDHEPTINKPDEKAVTLASVVGLIELRNVDFSYPSRPGVCIFKNFSLVIHPGKTVAIVGSSGSGKSTVVSLIERFYDPIAGEVWLDGHNLKTLNLKWLRGQIGLVNQEPALFATSIAANILYGKDDATQEEIVAGAKAANAHSFISELPLGYNTQVGERGIQLSGGQKQRVAIARAMLKNPRVLLLDEATSALDSHSEQIVQNALDRLMVGRTTVVVAHRLSTIRNANNIAVVQEGQIVEMGTHSELIKKEDGAYSSLIRLQELASTATGSLIRNKSRTPRVSVSRDGSGRASNAGPSNLIITWFGSLRSLSTRSVTSVADEDTAKQQAQGKGPVQHSEGSLARLLAITKPDWKYGILGCIGSLGSGCINPVFTILFVNVMTAYYEKNFNQQRKDVSKYSLIFVGLAIGTPLTYTLQHYNLGVLGEKLVNRVREKMFTVILRNELGWFDEEENNSNMIAARLASDATNVRAAIGDRISVLAQNATLLLLSYILAFTSSWKMTLVMGCGFPFLCLSSLAENYALTGFAGDQADSYSRASKVAGEAVASIRTVAAFHAEDKVQALFTQELVGPAKRSFLRGNVAGFGYGICQLMQFWSYALGLWYAGRLVDSGEASFKEILKVFFLLFVAAFGVSEALTLAPDLAKGGQAVKSVFKVLDRVTEIDSDDPKGEKIEKLRGDIELKHVTFAYPSRPDVIIFKDLNLSVYTGRSLALVGASGSGKSSVIALIERFYDPISGHVLIDGKDLKRYNLRSVRHHIALVQQEPALFSTTLYENILYGKEGASDAEVIEAAKVANAHNFISALPDGYKTQVGDRGVQLSGGQKQRVAIARAVLKDPAILLLDEATSALDAESENIVQEALDRLMKGRTTVIVAHRLSTIRSADTIAVVQEGTILEKGSHSELLDKAGGYARLINLQNREHESHSARHSSV